MVFMGMVVALGGCTRDPYVTNDDETRSGEWHIAHQIDRVIGAELPSATVFAGASNSNELFQTPSSLAISCLDRHPVVRFAFSFKIGTTQNVALGYRFDDKPGHENVPARIASGRQVIVLEDKATVAQFVSELKGSSKLYMRMRSLTAGRTSVEYPVEGSEAAILAAFAGCAMPPLPSPQQGRTSS
jgi:ureidoglycolate hydrolase